MKLSQDEADRRVRIQVSRRVCYRAMSLGMVCRRSLLARGTGCSEQELAEVARAFRDDEVLGWHGVGPKHLAQLRQHYGPYDPTLRRPEVVPALRPDTV